MKKFKGSQSLSNVIVVPVIHPESYHMFARHKQKEDDMYLFVQSKRISYLRGSSSSVYSSIDSSSDPWATGDSSTSKDKI